MTEFKSKRSLNNTPKDKKELVKFRIFKRGGKRPRSDNPQAVLSNGRGDKFNLKINSTLTDLDELHKKKVDAEIKSRNKLIKRRIKGKRALKMGWIGLCLIIVLVLISLFSRRSEPVFDLDSSSSYVKDLSANLKKDIKGGYIGILEPAWFRYSEIEKKVLSENDEVESIKLKFNFWKLRTEGTVTTKKPIIKLKSSSDGDERALIDADGDYFLASVEFTNMFNPVEVSQEDGNFSSGQKAVTDKLVWSARVIRLMEEGAAPVKALGVNLNPSNDIKSVEINVEGGGATRLIFSTLEDPERSAIAAVKAVSYLKSRPEGLGGLSYIDLRSPDRALYK